MFYTHPTYVTYIITPRPAAGAWSDLWQQTAGACICLTFRRGSPSIKNADGWGATGGAVKALGRYQATQSTCNALLHAEESAN